MDAVADAVRGARPIMAEGVRPITADAVRGARPITAEGARLISERPGGETDHDGGGETDHGGGETNHDL